MEIRKEYESVLEERVAQTIEKLQQKYKTDVINFKRSFHKKHPKVWSIAKDTGDAKFPKVDVVLCK